MVFLAGEEVDLGVGVVLLLHEVGVFFLLLDEGFCDPGEELIDAAAGFGAGEEEDALDFLGDKEGIRYVRKCPAFFVLDVFLVDHVGLVAHERHDFNG